MKFDIFKPTKWFFNESDDFYFVIHGELGLVFAFNADEIDDILDNGINGHVDLSPDLMQIDEKNVYGESVGKKLPALLNEATQELLAFLRD